MSWQKLDYAENNHPILTSTVSDLSDWMEDQALLSNMEHEGEVCGAEVELVENPEAAPAEAISAVKGSPPGMPPLISLLCSRSDEQRTGRRRRTRPLGWPTNDRL